MSIYTLIRIIYTGIYINGDATLYSTFLNQILQKQQQKSYPYLGMSKEA